MVSGVKCDIDVALKGVTSIQGDQLPFVIARSLTAVAQEAQKATRIREGQVFQLRNDWTTRNTKIVPATKQTLTSAVYTDTQNRSTGALDYLGRQEDSGDRVPIHGRQHIAIPTANLYRLIGGKGKVIPDWARPRNLIGLAANAGRYISRRGKSVSQSAQTRGYFFFLVTFKSGSHGLMARAAADAKGAAVVLYVFVTSAHIRKRLGMQEVVEHTVNEQFAAIFEEVAKDVGITVSL